MKIILTNISSRMSSIVALITYGGLSFWTSVQAQQISPGPSPASPPLTNINFTTISGAVCTLVNWLFTLLIVVTIVYVIIAAFKYLTAGGEEEKIKSANHMLIYAAVALAVGIVSRGIPILIGVFLGANALPTCG